jgi:shikimate kinase
MDTPETGVERNDKALSRSHIVLVGMMGSGKSSVGRALASRLERPLFDSDEMVEEEAGRTIREIWEVNGESAFRELETQALVDSLDRDEPSVIATGGGVVLLDRNRQLLTDSDAHVVWLMLDIEMLLDRVRNGVHRPLLDGDPEIKLRRMSQERESLYREVADAIVSVDNRSVLEVAKAVARCCG